MFLVIPRQRQTASFFFYLYQTASLPLNHASVIQREGNLIVFISLADTLKRLT
jgi:hypothetical protein